jgi:hypothetical protein
LSERFERFDISKEERFVGRHRFHDLVAQSGVGGGSQLLD